MTTAAQDLLRPVPMGTPVGPASTQDTATVTFLFAAGGGEGEERLGLLRSCARRFGGHELDATVESFPMSFPGPSAALACARELRGAAGELRIGIHCGEPLAIEDGRYFGAAVWTAARLCGRAEPGEILLSATAAELLPDVERARLTSVGSVRLKGVTEPVQLYEDSMIAAEGPDRRPFDRDARVLTILTVDQVGSTAILDRLGDDAARTVHTALMDVLRESIDEYRGTEIEYSGDGLAVRFDSALAAVGCAAAMQRDAARHRRRFPDVDLLLRAGVLSGEAVPSSPSSTRRLLVASARLMQGAGAEEVLVSPISARLASDRREHRFTPAADRNAQLLEWRPAARDGALPPGLHEADLFVGRDAELDQLQGAWDAVARGEQRLLAIDGPSGMGKTALAARFARLVTDGDGPGSAIVLYGRSAEVETRPLEALADAVSDPLATASRADVRRLLGERAPVLIPVLPVIADRLPAIAAVDVPEPARVGAWARAIDELVTGLCSEAPVLLVLDDLQNASASLLAAVRVLAEHGTPRPLLLLALFRPPDAGRTAIEAALDDGTARGAVIEHRSLTGLEPVETGELVAMLTAAPVDRGELRSIAAATDGRPRFVVQFALARLRATAREDAHRAFLDLTVEPGVREVRRLTGRILQLERLRNGSDPVTDHAEPTPETDPYRGLAPFDEAAAAWFFGREQLTAELVARVATSRVTAVVGASGSGKSSLVHAGLLPALARDVVPGSGAWTVATMVPGAHPLDALATSLAAALGGGDSVVRAGLRGPGLLDLIRDAGWAGQRLLLVVDQAEEVFTSAGAAERDRFAELLEDAVRRPGPVTVVLVLRAEFYGSWASYPHLAELIERNALLVRPMTDSELRLAVEAPASRAGLVVDPALVDAVVADVAGEPGALPLLSTAMSATWRRRRGRSLTLHAYAETGGVRRAVARLADAAYVGLPESRRSTARAVLLRLAQPGGPHGAIDVRRRAPLEELLELGDDAGAVIHAFVEQRLMIADRSTVEVAHEALLREWPLLRGWLDEDRAGRVVQQELASDSRTWRRRDRDPSLLYRGARLAVATELAANAGVSLTTAEREFLAASRADAADELARARRTTVRLRRLAAGLVGVMVAALLAGGIAAVQARTAADRATEASASALVAQADALDGTHADLAGLLALAAERLHPSPAAAASVLAAADSAPDLQRVIPIGAGDATGAVSRNGRAAAATGSDGSVTDMDLTTGKQLGRLMVRGTGAETPVALSSTGRFLAVAAGAGLQILDTRTDHVVRSGGAAAIAFLADDVLAAVGSGDVLAGFDSAGRTRYVDPASGHSVPFRAPPAGGTVAASVDDRVEVWSAVPTRLSKNPFVSTFGAISTHVVDIASRKQVGAAIPGVLAGMSADGHLLAVLRDRDLVILDRSTHHVVRSVVVGSALTTGQVRAAAPAATVTFDATSHTVAFEGADAGNPIHLVDLATGVQRTEPIPLAHSVRLPAFDGGRLVVPTKGGAAVVAPAPAAPAPRDGTRLARNEYNPIPRAFVATDPSRSRVVEVVSAAGHGPDRYRVASADAPGIGPLLAPAGGRRFDVTTAAFSADGRRLATLEWDPHSVDGAAISVWDTSTGRRLGSVGPLAAIPPDEHVLPVSKLAFVSGTDELAAVTVALPPDGGAATSPLLQVWRLGPRAGAPLVDVGLDVTEISGFSADGRTLATMGSDILNFWSVRTGRLTASGPIPMTPYEGSIAASPVFSDLTFTEDGRYLSGGGSLTQSDAVARWRVAAPQRPAFVALPDEVEDHGWAVSPDGTTVADVGPGGIEFRSFATGRVQTDLQSTATASAILGFTGSGDSIVVWDGSRLELIDRSGDTVQLGAPRTAPPTSVVDDVPDVVMTRSGLLTSVTSGTDVVVHQYTVTAADAERRVCTIAGRDITQAEWTRYLPGVPYRQVCGASAPGR